MNGDMHKVISVARMAASLILSNGGETYRRAHRQDIRL